MPRRAKKVKHIMIAKHRFILEIYLALEGTKDLTWEIFPCDHEASLYAFSNKKRLEKIIEKKYIYENS